MSVRQKAKKLFTDAIYNSRNLKCLLDKDVRFDIVIDIYNSRNLKCLLDRCIGWCVYFSIYNSRNLKCLLDRAVLHSGRFNLQ